MKRFLMLVLMLCVGLCAGCAQNQHPILRSRKTVS